MGNPNIREKVEQIFEEGKKPTDEDIKKLVSEEVEKHYGDWKTEDFTEEVPDNFLEDFKEKYGSTIEEIKNCLVL